MMTPFPFPLDPFTPREEDDQLALPPPVFTTNDYHDLIVLREFEERWRRDGGVYILDEDEPD